MRSLCVGCVVLLAATTVLPIPAAANSTGISGVSGKQGTICNQCHGGGTAPLVHFEGPQEVAAGAIATFRFVIEAQAAAQTHAGLNVAATGGSLAIVAGQGERLIGDELTHSAPKLKANGATSFQFTWTAPTTTGMQTLFGAGNSVNRNFIDTGDRAAAATVVINVVAAGVPTPSPTPSPTPPSSCIGDCSGDGQSTIDDLALAVNVATGVTGITTCGAVDTNRNDTVEMIELVAAIETALTGCSP